MRLARRGSLWAGVALSLAGVAALAFTFQQPPEPPPTPPKASFSPVVRLAAAEQNTPVVAYFVVSNVGDELLTLHDFKTGCSCEGIDQEQDGAFVRVSQVDLTRGESARLRYIRNVVGTVGDPSYAAVRFATNDPTTPEGTVTVVIDRLTGGFSTRPGDVVFGSLDPGVVHDQSVELFDASEHPRGVEQAVSSDPERVLVALLPGAGDATTIGRLVVTIPKAVTGEIDATISLMLRGSATPHTLRVTGRVATPVELTPRELYLPRATASGPRYTADVLVRSSLGADATVECPSVPAGFTVVVSPGTSPIHRLTVTADPATCPAECELAVVVRRGAETRTARLRVVCHPSEARP